MKSAPDNSVSRDQLRRGFAFLQAGQAERASEFVQKAFRAGSYDEVLRLCMEYVEVR